MFEATSPALADPEGGLAYDVVVQARNARGSTAKKLRIIIGEKIARTPPMGWNSWNCWAGAVDQEKVLRSARAMVSKGLINHGWTYVNIDDTWQGQRGGTFNGLQPNEKFPDMKKLCDEIHGMGLKAGIYSTPWITSYARFAGGSSDDPSGAWTKNLASQKSWRCGKYSFAVNDAKQWAAWGFDYLKYDWNPNDLPHVEEMSKALRGCGRDMVYSLSNTAPFEHAADWARLANCWRTTGDIWDHWAQSSENWQYGVSEIGFNQDRWAPFGGPGHWNDPDMLVVGHVGWGPALHLTRLSADEQYSHISLWCLLSAPLLIGCDMDRLDPFTIGLLSNDEVLALDQDALGQPAVRVGTVDAFDVFKKSLEDGSTALGFFNRARQTETATFNKLERIGLAGNYHVRDLWRQKDLDDTRGSLKLTHSRTRRGVAEVDPGRLSPRESSMNERASRSMSHSLKSLCLVLVMFPCGLGLMGAGPPGAVPAVRQGPATVYVSSLGDDSDGSSWKKAFRTIQGALSEGTWSGRRAPHHRAAGNLSRGKPGAPIPGRLGAYNLLVGDVDGRLGSGAVGRVIIDSGDPSKGFKSYDWWGPIRAYSKGWSKEHTGETASSLAWDRWILRNLYVTGGDGGSLLRPDRQDRFAIQRDRRGLCEHRPGVRRRRRGIAIPTRRAGHLPAVVPPLPGLVGRCRGCLRAGP